MSPSSSVPGDNKTVYLGEIFYGLCEGHLGLYHVKLSQVASALGVLCTKSWPKCVHSRKTSARVRETRNNCLCL